MAAREGAQVLAVHAGLACRLGEVALGAGQHVAQVVALEVLDEGGLGLGEGQVGAQGQLGPGALRVKRGAQLLEGAGGGGQGATRSSTANSSRMASPSPTSSPKRRAWLGATSHGWRSG